MVKNADEIPITYLNKGQAYTMTVVDTASAGQPVPMQRYRTFVRISFEDEQQRSKSAACWQLWKEGRGTNEAHQRGGKLQAVEFVDPNQGGEMETRSSQVELETASFDGFSITWVPKPATGAADCSVAVRFNFLSTDFSHSKGVKGIPVRLCAKTEMLPDGLGDTSTATGEVAYCKVKLFRDHGAERKLANDIAHVKKTIDKFKQQIAQSEAGMANFGKRKRSGSMSGRPVKMPKHRRTWSTSSQSDGGRPAGEDDLHAKLDSMQDMFSSTRPVSVLYLRGQDQDDPDLFPVRLPGSAPEALNLNSMTRQNTWDSKATGDATPSSANFVSPTPSSQTMKSPIKAEATAPGFQHSIPFSGSRHNSSEWHNVTDQPVKVPVNQPVESGSLTNWIDALGVDAGYQPPPERLIKPGKSAYSLFGKTSSNNLPVACCYVLIKFAGNSADDGLYRAVYLMEKTVKELVKNIAAKCNIEPSRLVRSVRVNPKGIKIAVDNDVVRELPEGQDMIVDFTNVNLEKAPRVSPERGPSAVQVDGDTPVTETKVSGLEMTLRY